MSSFRQAFPYFIVIVIDVFGYGMLAPVLAPLVVSAHSPLFSDYTHLAERHLIYGWLLAISPLCFVFGAPLLGFLSDCFGRKRILFLSLVGTCVGFVAYISSLLAMSLSLLFVARICIGLTSGSESVAQAAMADVSQGNAKVANIGLIALAMTIGLVLGPLMGGVLSDPHLVAWFGLTTPFYVALLLSLLNLWVLHIAVPADGVRSSAVVLPDLWQRLRRLFANRQVRELLYCFFVFELAWSLYFQSLGLVLVEQFHFSGRMLGVFSGFVGLCLSLGLTVGVRCWLRFMPRISIAAVSLLLACVALLFSCLIPTIRMQWLMVLPIGLGVACAYATLVAQLSDQAGATQQGLVMGVADSVLALAFAITGFLVGHLVNMSLMLPQLFAAFLMLSAFALCFVWRLSEKRAV